MKKRKQSSIILPILLVLFLILTIADGVFLMKNYTWASGGFRRKGAEELDLRGEQLTVTELKEIQKKFPRASITWDVPFQNGYISSDVTEISCGDLTTEDIAMLKYFPNLKRITATGCKDYPGLAEYIKQHRGLKAACGAIMSGVEIPANSTVIRVKDANPDELNQQLPFLLDLQKVILTGSLPESDALSLLRKNFPKISFEWQLNVAGQTVSNTLEQLSLRGKSVTFEEVSTLLSRMRDLKELDLRDTSLDQGELRALASRYQDCSILFEMEAFGQLLCTDVEEIEISGHRLTGPGEVENLLPYFHNLKRVTILDSGLSNEVLASLNQRHPDIRFVWNFKIQDVELRTDITWFYPFMYHKNMVVDDEDLIPLQYCEDIEAIDIGHMSGVTNCEFVRNMPNLKYLIIIETNIVDISPLEGLKNLVFLEMFTTNITDYTPLLGCTALQDLNLGLTYGPEEPILEMTWLKNLWWMGIEGSRNLPCSDAPDKLREALPNTRIKFQMESPNEDNGWRQLQNYYNMRDLIGVFYLT